MSPWLEVFIVVVSVAIIVQLALLIGMLFQLRFQIERFMRFAGEVQSKLDPILFRANRLLEVSEEHIATIMSDAAEVTRVARSQAQKIDRVFTDAVERLREQVIRADHILSGALEVIDDAGSKFRRVLWGPIQQASAVLKGLKAGIEYIRGQQQKSPAQVSQDEELFI